MDALEPRAAMVRALAGALYVASAALLVLLQEVGLRLRREEQRAWWPGSGRDLLNGLGFAAVAASLRLFGFPLAAAIAVGATVTLALFGTSILMETRARTRRPRAWAFVAGVALATPVICWPRDVLAAFGYAVKVLFPVE